MTVESKKMLSMAAAIVRGVRKKDTHLVTDAEESKTWDRVAASIAETEKRNPGVAFDIPSDD